MGKEKPSQNKKDTATTSFRPISLKGALKVIREKPQEEFDRLRRYLETHDLPPPCDPES